MAGTAFAALQSLENTLCLIDDHPRHCFYFEKEQLDPLMESVRFLMGFMLSFDESHGAIKDAAGAFDSRIARAAQAAEDVIESHVVDQIRRGSTLGGSRTFFLWHKKIINFNYKYRNNFQRDDGSVPLKLLQASLDLNIQSKKLDLSIRREASIGKRSFRFLLDLQKAIEDMDYVRRKVANFEASPRAFNADQPLFSETSSSTSLALEKNKMVGFDDQLRRLLDLLTEGPSSREVICIVGMAGIGKTILANNAFQHPFIVDYFDVCALVTVSQKFSVTELLYALHSQIKEINFPPNKKQKNISSNQRR